MNFIKRTISGDRGPKRSDGQQLHLPGCNLRFNQQQLTALNNHFSNVADKQLTGNTNEETDVKMMVTMERLIMRLVSGVGTLDKRFASKFLVNLQTHKSTDNVLGRKRLSYMVRLDSLSEPALYPKSDRQASPCQLLETESCPQGFAKIRLAGSALQQWAEFISPQGFLRRDKIQERYVELLASSAARGGLVGPPSQLDESLLCASPGKVVDPDTLNTILSQLPPEKQVFYGPAECHRTKFPDPRDFRIAIVEGCTCIRLRVGLSSFGQHGVETDVEVTLVVGIGFSWWPSGSQFPSRIDLCHMDALLYYQAATTGFYAVPAPPHPTVRCEDRSTLWQLRMPAAEAVLTKHYSNSSVPVRVLCVIRSVLAEMRAAGVTTTSDYVLRTLLWHRLEEGGSVACASGAAVMRSWTHQTLASHVLVLLDKLLIALNDQSLPSYFFPWFNVMLNCAGGGTVHYTEEDYRHDGELVCRQLVLLEQLSTRQGPPPVVPTRGVDCWRKVDTKLIERWADVLAQLTPPPANRSTRLASPGKSTMAASQYSERQLDYIGLLLRSMLTIRSLTLAKSSSLPSWGQCWESNSKVEDLVFLVSSVLEQAKSSLLQQARRTSGVQAKLDSYESSVNALLEDVRAEEGRTPSPEGDIDEDARLVRQLLKWLYRAVDRSGRGLSRVIRPYLAGLFAVSHETCWHLPEWNRRRQNRELAALGQFNAVVLAGHATPTDALTDAYEKGWSWAESMLEMSTGRKEGVELVYCPRAGRVVRHRISGTKMTGHNLHGGLQAPLLFGTLRHPNPSSSSSKYASATLPRHMKPFAVECLTRHMQNGGRGNDSRDEIQSSVDQTEGDLLHDRLRACSPLSNTLETSHRKGNHRGLGNIVNALIQLRKFTVLQEVCALLPPEDRYQLLDEIQRVARGSRRRAAPSRGADNGGNAMPKAGTVSCASLAGTCRAARRRHLHHPITSNNPILDPEFFRRPEIFRPPPLDEMVHLSLHNEPEAKPRHNGRKEPSSIAL